LAKGGPDLTAEELREAVADQIREKIRQSKIFLYAESLRVPEEILPEWKHTPLPDVEKIWAHLYQRQMTYPLDPSKLELFKKAIYFLYFAGNQGGKSVWATAWVVMECLGIHPLQQDGMRPNPPLHWWVVSPELPADSQIYGGKTEGGMDTETISTFTEWLPPGCFQFYRKDKLMVITSLDGKKSTVNFKSHDQQKSKFKGERLDGIMWNEEPPKPLWKEGIPRILKKKGIFLLAMTADYGSWTYELLNNRGDPAYQICEMDSTQNPFMPDAHRKMVLASLTAEEQLMRRFGKHIQFEGRVFKAFDRDLHVGSPFVVNNECAVFVVIDWHPVKPIMISYIAVDIRGIWYQFAESVVTDHIVLDVVQEIGTRLQREGVRLRVRKYVIDRIAQIKQIQDEVKRAKSIVDMLRDFHIRCEIGDTTFATAHAKITDKMVHREWYLDPGCVKTIEQFETWGAKRYEHGNFEGTLRDHFETEGDDFPMNHVYAYNAGLKSPSTFIEVPDEGWRPRASSARLYGHGGR
jgi:phage terminase large subunit-like protein